MRWLALLWLSGCGPDPLNNDPARLEFFNGVDRISTRYQNLPPFTPGQDYPIDMVFADPEGDAFEVFFPWAPPGWEVDERTGQGVYHVPLEMVDGAEIRWVTVDARGARGGGYEWIPAPEQMDTGAF